MEGSSVDSNYCPNCGSLLGQSVNYCSQCGTQCRKVSPTNDSRDAGDSVDDEEVDIRAFRRRVRTYRQDGWEVEHDYGDSVVLANRGVGHPVVHLILFFTTLGFGNLIYGAYKHSHSAERMEIHADGTDPSSRDIDIGREKEEDSVGSYIVGSLLLLMGIGSILSNPLSPIALIIGFLMLAGSAHAFPPTKRRLKNRHPVTRFGPVRSTDEEIISDPNRPCTICGSPIETGVRRSYREEYTVAGVPLFTTETGENHYCQECNSGDMDHTSFVSMDSEGTPGNNPTDRSPEENTLETEWEQ
jgi:hypothetical protein